MHKDLPGSQLVELRERIGLLENELAAVRRQRREIVTTMRSQLPPVTWRRIAELTGASEGYWRRELNS